MAMDLSNGYYDLAALSVAASLGYNIFMVAALLAPLRRLPLPWMRPPCHCLGGAHGQRAVVNELTRHRQLHPPQRCSLLLFFFLPCFSQTITGILSLGEYILWGSHMIKKSLLRFLSLGIIPRASQTCP